MMNDLQLSARTIEFIIKFIFRHYIIASILAYNLKYLSSISVLPDSGCKSSKEGILSTLTDIGMIWGFDDDDKNDDVDDNNDDDGIQHTPIIMVHVRLESKNDTSLFDIINLASMKTKFRQLTNSTTSVYFISNGNNLILYCYQYPICQQWLMNRLIQQSNQV